MNRVLEEIPAGACLVDGDGRVTAANRALASLVGADSGGAVVETPVGDLFADDGTVERTLEAALADGANASGEWWVESVEGPSVREVTCSPVADDDRHAALVVVREGRDDETGIEVEGQRWSDLLESFPLAVLTLRADGSVSSWNPAAERLLEWTESDVLGRRPPFLAPGTERQWNALREQVRRGEVLTDVDLRVRTAKGTLRHVTVSGAPLPDDRTLVVVRDVTAPRERAEQLQLLDRVLRHNIRNDMNVVMGHAERLVDAVDDPRLTESVSAILDRSEDIIDLSDKAREFTDVIKGEHDLVVVDAAAVVRRQVAECREAYAGVTFDVDGPEEARVSAVRSIEIAFRNLLENAVEHNDADRPRVGVSVREANIEGRECVEVAIRDNGPGIPRGEREVFIQGSEDPLNHGSGLGLWLVYWIVRRSNGELLFSENEPRGSVLTVRLERARDFSF